MWNTSDLILRCDKKTPALGGAVQWSETWSESVSESPDHLQSERSHCDQAADVISPKEVCWNFRISKDFLPLASRQALKITECNNNKSVSEVLLSLR